jgi:hypothetical protein
MTAAAPIALPATAKKRRRLVLVESDSCDMIDLLLIELGTIIDLCCGERVRGA